MPQLPLQTPTRWQTRVEEGWEAYDIQGIHSPLAMSLGMNQKPLLAILMKERTDEFCRVMRGQERVRTYRTQHHRRTPVQAGQATSKQKPATALIKPMDKQGTICRRFCSPLFPFFPPQPLLCCFVGSSLSPLTLTLVISCSTPILTTPFLVTLPLHP